MSLLVSVVSNAQINKRSIKDSSVSFSVMGACEQCKDRIETAAKIKGVKTAVWDVDKQLLSLTFNRFKIIVAKV